GKGAGSGGSEGEDKEEEDEEEEQEGLEEDNLRELLAGGRGKRLEAAKRKLSRAAAEDNPEGGEEEGADNESDGESDEDMVEARKAAEYFEDGDAGVVSPA
ncbi:unnamed protein product, partial [Laminaria digitata]